MTHGCDGLCHVGRQIGAGGNRNRDRRKNQRDDETLHEHSPPKIFACAIAQMTKGNMPHMRPFWQGRVEGAFQLDSSRAFFTAWAAAASAWEATGMRPCMEKNPWIMLG